MYTSDLNYLLVWFIEKEGALRSQQKIVIESEFVCAQMYQRTDV